MIGGQRLFEHGHAEFGELRRDFERSGFVVAAVGVRPEKAIGRQTLHEAAAFQIELRIGRDLYIEVTVTTRMALRDQVFNFVQPARVKCPTQRDAVASFAGPALRGGFPEQLPSQIEQREVDARFANRLTCRKRWRNDAVHHRVNHFHIERIASD
jgi:hypothetical protein